MSNRRDGYYVVILDEPLNMNPSDLEEPMTEFYIAFHKEHVARHVLIVFKRDLFDGNLVIEAMNHKDSGSEYYVDYVSRFQGELGFCLRCKKAQFNRNLLVTCTRNHTLCKKCIVPWNEEENRADLQNCAEFTAQMNHFCMTTLQYEPTCLPTRVLLGHIYWATEDKQRAVREFSDCDSWVCWFCRFLLDEEFPVNFRFVHDQLFPGGEGLEEVVEELHTARAVEQIRQTEAVEAHSGGEVVEELHTAGAVEEIRQTGAVDAHSSDNSPFDCAMCFSEFVNPVTTSCGHTFCRTCYVMWTRKGKVTCPSCRGQIPRESPALNVTLRDALAHIKSTRPMPSLASINETDLIIGTILGQGGFCVVHNALWKGSPVAVKCLQRDATEVGEAPAKAFEREMTVLAQLRHPNIVSVFGVCHHSDHRISLVEEIATGGTLYRKLHPVSDSASSGAPAAPLPLRDIDITRIGVDIVRALEYAHNMGVTHNDIKSSNVLFKADGTALLGDFGLAKRIRTALPNTVAILNTTYTSTGGGMLGTVEWTAPENGNPTSPWYGQPPGDVYSLGMVLFEMVSCATPWEGLTMFEIVTAVIQNKRPIIPEHVDAGLKDIILRCWAPEPADRPSIGQLLVELVSL